MVDDHAIVRNGLAHLLATVEDVELVGTAADGAEAVTVVERCQPDVVLLDLSMPGVDGVEAMKRILAGDQRPRILVLTSFGDQSRIMDALTAGADGYLLKDAEPDEIVGAIRAVHEGGSPLDPRAARVLLEARRVRDAVDLTDREIEVLRLVAAGLANKHIARRLAISERTVKAHLTSVFQRIGVTDRTQAALWAERNGLRRGPR